MARKKIWTPAVREFLFTMLVEEFGPYDGWELSARPKAGGPKQEVNVRYVEFLTAFAKMVGAKSYRAVEQQVAYSLMPKAPRPVDEADTRAHAYYVNRHYAAKHGFIEKEF